MLDCACNFKDTSISMSQKGPQMEEKRPLKVDNFILGVTTKLLYNIILFKKSLNTMFSFLKIFILCTSMVLINCYTDYC